MREENRTCKPSFLVGLRRGGAISIWNAGVSERVYFIQFAIAATLTKDWRGRRAMRALMITAFLLGIGSFAAYRLGVAKRRHL